MNIPSIKYWFEQGGELQIALAIILIFIFVVLVYWLLKKIVVRLIVVASRRSQTKIDDIILKHINPNRLAITAPLGIVYFLSDLFPSYTYYIQKLVLSTLLWIALVTITALFDAINEIYESRQEFTGTPIKGFLDIVKIILYLMGIILTISYWSGESPIVLLGGLGAMTAILLLIFQDTILALVASVVITSNDLIREGDWLEVPSFEADGDVVDIGLHAVKIQNWDKTISVVPTSKFMGIAYKNWRGMSQTGARRIKRALYIDLNTVRFCDEEMLQNYSKIHLLENYLTESEFSVAVQNTSNNMSSVDRDDMVEVINHKPVTNIGVFRAYITAYLKTIPEINQKMTFLVRQLAPTEYGLPIEIYVFSSETEWVAYENLQARIFDHLLAVVPLFGLRLFQNPSGRDFTALTSATA